MNTLQCLAVSSILLFANGSAFADAHLTPQQCDDYPFKRPVGEVTHAQLMQELAELQAVGYSGRDDNAYYPNDLQKAEASLQAEYKRDCLQLRQPD